MGKSPDTYRYLRQRLRELGVDVSYLSQLLGFSSPTSASDRLSGRANWRQSEMYRVLEIIREPPERLHIVFPPDGVEFRRRGRPQKERQKSPKELLIEALGLMEAEERKEPA